MNVNEPVIAATEDDDDVTVIGDAAALTMGGQADGGEGKRHVYSYTG
ncbi:putative RiPP precursor [Kitasatospora purpeofusca]|uniref:RiPP n=1 Tax=Kitasatospora purpeofusca TaxID=67352 RepID=A0ABZ1TXH6_9ACTN|nr:putative RiPP precursor [Kitasatospora purpeofusca]